MNGTIAEPSQDNVDALLKYIADARVYLGLDADSEAAAAAAALIFGFETELAKIFVPKDQLRDPESQYNVVTLEKLGELCTSVDWAAYFTAIGAPIDGMKLVVSNFDYLKRLDALLKSTPGSTLQLYLEWHAITTFGSSLGEPLANIWLEFVSRTRAAGSARSLASPGVFRA